MSEDYRRGVLAGIGAVIVGLVAGVLIVLHLKPKPSQADAAAPLPDGAREPERKAVGFHATMKQPEKPDADAPKT